MAVSVTVDSVTYQGNASTVTAYTVTFQSLEPEHVKCYIREPLFGVNSVFPAWVAIDPADYTVTLDPETGLGTVTTDPAIPNTRQIKIARSVPLTQETEYPVSGAFPAASHETALDKLTMICQDLGRRVADLETQLSQKIQTVLEMDLGGGDPLGVIPNDTWVVIKDTSNDSVTLWVAANDGVGGVALIAAP